ncbi:hypothetical protein CK203_008429 [Vitis vinifera]|uniref:Uncharacterized protein n=1 Tax=Vitis vinifera TaxID=29760 RepID=A0A438KNP4_VITVI|nr:hypothetical protein CK203_008429 [Vitis vinifera]
MNPNMVFGVLWQGKLKLLLRMIMKPNKPEAQQPEAPGRTSRQGPGTVTGQVAMAMAAKAKLLLRELKTVKADLAFAKERCAQLEEENRILREHHEKGDNQKMMIFSLVFLFLELWVSLPNEKIRLQLETLLAEKARLAQENSVYARENRFLREIVEYHQLTMQDVIYLDERTEEVTEVYPIKVPTVNNLHSVATTLPPLASSLPFEGGPKTSPQGIQHVSTAPVPPQALAEISQSVASQNLHIPVPL